MDAPSDWQEWAPAIALLKEAKQYGVEIVFSPDFKDGQDNGWTIFGLARGFPAMHENPYFPGVQLSSAYDLETACNAALKPLIELSDQLDAAIARRQAEEQRS